MGNQIESLHLTVKFYLAVRLRHREPVLGLELIILRKQVRLFSLPYSSEINSCNISKGRTGLRGRAQHYHCYQNVSGYEIQMGAGETVIFVTIAKHWQKVCPITCAKCWQTELPDHWENRVSGCQIVGHKQNNLKKFCRQCHYRYKIHIFIILHDDWSLLKYLL